MNNLVKLLILPFFFSTLLPTRAIINVIISAIVFGLEIIPIFLNYIEENH